MAASVWKDTRKPLLPPPSAEIIMRLFTTGKPGAADIMIKLNKVADANKAEVHKVYISIPWDYELPPRPAHV